MLTLVILETAGGGGFGNPLERDPEAVRGDVLEGLVSKRQAEDIYGLVFADGTLDIDITGTMEKRRQLLHQPPMEN